MARRITVRIPQELADWLAEASRRTGLSRAALARDAIEEARARTFSGRFLHLAGSVRGARDLSQRKGFSRTPG